MRNCASLLIFCMMSMWASAQPQSYVNPVFSEVEFTLETPDDRYDFFSQTAVVIYEEAAQALDIWIYIPGINSYRLGMGGVVNDAFWYSARTSDLLHIQVILSKDQLEPDGPMAMATLTYPATVTWGETTQSALPSWRVEKGILQYPMVCLRQFELYISPYQLELLPIMGALYNPQQLTIRINQGWVNMRSF